MRVGQHRGAKVAIPISKTFLTEQIAGRWDTVDELAKGWAERVSIGLQKVGMPRDRATIYRWLSQGLPNKRDEIFGLSAVLGIDPIVMLDLESVAFQKLLKLEWVFFLANMEGRGRMSALWPLVRPSAHWPNLSISHDYYSCSWTTIEVRHAATSLCNEYAQFRLQGDPDEDQQTAHRIYYFAYRRHGARDGFWRPYGIVRKRGLEAICVGHNGDMMEQADGLPTVLKVDETGYLDVETFFGPGPADFKVACIHPFTLECIVPSRASSFLRFSG